MILTTDVVIGRMLFISLETAESFVFEMADMADEGETFEVQSYQGNRYQVARYYNGKFEAYC